MPYIHGKSIIKIALADDHEMFREAIATHIDGFDNCKVVIQAASGRELLEKLEQKPTTHLVLLDIAMPEIDGFETAYILRSRFPEMKIIFCSMYHNELAICRMLDAGANGFIDKTASMGVLKKGIYQVMKNSRNIQEPKDKMFFYNEGIGTTKNLNYYPLSQTEIQFLNLICTEKPYKLIAKELQLSERQIDYIRESLFCRFEVRSRIGLAIIANLGGIQRLQIA